MAQDGLRIHKNGNELTPGNKINMVATQSLESYLADSITTVEDRSRFAAWQKNFLVEDNSKSTAVAWWSRERCRGSPFYKHSVLEARRIADVSSIKGNRELATTIWRTEKVENCISSLISSMGCTPLGGAARKVGVAYLVRI